MGISGTNHKPKIPDEQEAAQAIDTLLADTSRSATERAIDLALYIMHKQLFWDGNKRTANLTANAVLIQHGAGVLSISTNNITEFNQLLKYYYDTNDDQGLKRFLYETAIVNFDSKNDTVHDTVKSTEQRVLEVVRHSPSATYEDIAHAIGKTRVTVARAIMALKDRGIIRREGSDKSGVWVIE